MMNKQMIFTILLSAVLGITGYLWYGYFHAPPVEEGALQSRAPAFSQVGGLQNIRLDTSVFEDLLFRSLQPPQVIPQPDVTPGRTNPFAPF